MHVLVSGSSGLIGSALTVSLPRRGHTVARLLRGAARAREQDVVWDPETGDLDPPELRSVDALVHLAGENIGREWTAARKAAIRASRVDATRHLCQTLAQMKNPPRVLICASAVGYYGDRGDEELDESAPPGHGFLADVCRDWEAATDAAAKAGIRTVNVRLAPILDPASGPLARMLPLFAAGLGGRLGSGRQYMSWGTLPDVLRAIEFALEREDLAGPVNVVAPQAVTNAEFTRTLAAVLHRPALLPVPGFVLRIVLGGQRAGELLLSSARVVPRRLQAAGFQFENPELHPALEQLLEQTGRL
jgi:uncharacterized protein (TIGR01777 family)